MLLDDPSPLVRRALADALAASPSAPPAIVIALAADQPQIAAPVYALSPLFVDADLVDAVATGGPVIQAAIASRAALPRSVAAAIAEVGTAEVLPDAGGKLRPPISRRFRSTVSSSASVISPRSARRCCCATIFRRPRGRRLVTKLSETLAGFVAGRAWLDADHAQRIAREACEKATVAIAAETPETEVRPLIRHLCASGQLTAGLILRALLSGNVVLFEEALAELADMPVARVSGLLHDRGSVGVARAVRKGRAAAVDLSRLQGSDRGDARRLRTTSRAAPRG